MKRSVLPLFAFAALLGGCSGSGIFSSSANPPVCPTASIVEDANRITVYRPGPGRDIADIAYEARMISIDGDCSYTILKKSKEASEQTYSAVSMSMHARFLVTPGPALTGYKMPLNYFVSIPDFYPNPEGHAEFTRDAETSATKTQVDITDANVDIRIPLNGKRRGDSITVYAGFVLTEDQLRENRSRGGGRLNR